MLAASIPRIPKVMSREAAMPDVPSPELADHGRQEPEHRPIAEILSRQEELLVRLLESAERSREEYRQGTQALFYELDQVRREIQAVRNMEAIRWQREELEREPRYQEPLRLPRHAFQVNSQNGEDGIIHEIFRRIGATSRRFVEVGVGDGTENNTAFLLSQGWTGCWIDTRDAFVATVTSRTDLRDGCLAYRVTAVDRDNAAGLLRELDVPPEFDLLSLDIDQNTYHVWEALHEFAPRAVVVEYNAAIPPAIDWQVHYAADRAWDGSQNAGASLKAFELLGRRLGYCLVGCDYSGVNAFFVRSDLAAGQFAEPFTAENHYEPPRYPHLLHRRGHPRAILDRIPPAGRMDPSS